MFDPWLSLPHPPLRGASWLREELEPEALAQGLLGPLPTPDFDHDRGQWGSVPSACGFTGGPGGWAEKL